MHTTTDDHPAEAARILRRVVDRAEIPTIQGEQHWYTANEIAGWLTVAQGDDVYATEIHEELAKRAYARVVKGGSWEYLSPERRRELIAEYGAVVEDLADLGVIGRAGDNGGLIDTDGVADIISRLGPRLALAIADLLEGKGDLQAIAHAVVFPSETQEPQ